MRLLAIGFAARDLTQFDRKACGASPSDASTIHPNLRVG
jgi:hypothetical protein